MRKGRFPPFGLIWRELGLWVPVLKLFMLFFDVHGSSQKDARDSLSPLRVHMEGVWALGACFDVVLSVF
jgi:hypothetical protein